MKIKVFLKYFVEAAVQKVYKNYYSEDICKESILRGKCAKLGWFGSVFDLIQKEYGDLQSKSSH